MDRSDINVIFIHGNNGGKEPGGSSKEFWYPWAAKEFEKRGFRVTLKDFPDPRLARMNIWLPFLSDVCGANEHSILIGHSSGAIAAMRYAERKIILGSVLVGAYCTDTGDEAEKMSGYFDAPWDWPSIRKHQQWIIQFASVDDLFFSIEEPRLVSRELSAEYHEYEDRGHFFDTEFSELVDAVGNRFR